MLIVANPQELVAAAAAALERVRAQGPAVHCITNTVAQAFTANCCLALGIRPSMTTTPLEISFFVEDADAVLVNLGTLDSERRSAIAIAVDTMRDERRPWVLDPVFAHLSPPRMVLARELVAQQPSVIRGNQAEVKAMASRDSDPATALARESMAAIVETGAEDLIAYDGTMLRSGNGVAQLAQVTATGCAGAALTAAFCAVEDNPVIAALAGVLTMNIAAEKAAERAGGPGSFAVHLIDQLALITPEQMMQRARVSA